MTTWIGNKEFLKSELPPKAIDFAVRSITRPKRVKSPDVEDAIPWPKLEGSLPIQSPQSVSPRPLGRDRSKSVFQPPIVQYRRQQ